GDAIKAAGEQIQQRDSKPYVNAAPAAK
ncbi:hypothetical protein STIAU_6606, partial [Stigmatella aurantiaca DW4/3-1]